ncbi:hypothetical protein KFL_005330080 [Klebsormidium nitens]|uniref:MaoC-like domain-containing protein n=1 Tax=Klebsormidium nitens TaxID=105231 RepID=A0A1Y1IFX2_KLENI|nr:hypothetical protein KFL_005330080 [Klebsormidium nitens]|eukprot:GAQ89533.1 hypothetical protein KFL_005330080 [Klebsormidium nitens]
MLRLAHRFPVARSSFSIVKSHQDLQLRLASAKPAAKSASEDVPSTEHLKGRSFELERVFSKKDLLHFGWLTGDSNPIHLEDSAARRANFESCVVHGMLAASLFPAIIGSKYPGAVYLSQEVNFKAPLLVDEHVTATVKCTSAKLLRQTYRAVFSTVCCKDDGTVVIDGVARALIPVASVKAEGMSTK